jgi:hypothetical protein
MTLHEIIEPVRKAESQFPHGSYEHSEHLKVLLLGVWPKLKALAEMDRLRAERDSSPK